MATPISSEIGLEGRTAVVTGAAGGIGTATCESLAHEGADIVATDVDESGLTSTEERVEGHGRTCKTVVCDVTDADHVTALRETAFEVFDSVEILVTAHGVVSRVSLPEMTTEEWHRVLEVNLTGTYLTTQAFCDRMVENGYGKVVCVGSIAGEVGGVISGPHYVASKGGVHAFVKWVAKDVASNGVYVNAIAPGPVRTTMVEGEEYTDDMAPLNRLGEPEDIAEGVVFLSSQQSNWITGTVLNVNGGMLME